MLIEILPKARLHCKALTALEKALFPSETVIGFQSHCRFENKICEEGGFSAYPAFTTWPNVSVTR